MVPFTRPNPPRLSEAAAELRAVEDSGIFSNFGPANTRFENDLIARMFAGEGACATVCNATIGLMLAIRAATEDRKPRRRFALMPSFTFAAAAQAALWCGLTPLFCDIDPETWAADPAAEERLLKLHRGSIAVIVPYATFGYPIDLDRYEAMARQHNVPVVVDAAASLGTRRADGAGFGTGFSGTVVYSMHATKSFSTGEGGVIYSGDRAAIARIRTMANFGFGKPRQATMPGLNAKLSEVGAVLASLRLADYDAIVDKRAALMAQYRTLLPELAFQPDTPSVQAHQFAPALLPREIAPLRSVLQTRMKSAGVDTASYFSPHVAEQEYFRRTGFAAELVVTDDVASRVISLPIFDTMTREQVIEVATCLRGEIGVFSALVDGALIPTRENPARPAPITVPMPIPVPAASAAVPVWQNHSEIAPVR